MIALLTALAFAGCDPTQGAKKKDDGGDADCAAGEPCAAEQPPAPPTPVASNPVPPVPAVPPPPTTSFKITSAGPEIPSAGYVATWTRLSGAKNYHLVVSGSDTCADPLWEDDVAGIYETQDLASELPVVEEGTYWLCVDAQLAADKTLRAENAPFKLVVAPGPGLFYFTTTTGVVTSATPLIAWQASENAVKYVLTVLDWQFDKVREVETTETSLELATLADGYYYVTVDAYDEHGSSAPAVATSGRSFGLELIIDTTPFGSWSDRGDATFAPRSDPVAVWTGSKVIVWGGADKAVAYATGGVYDPAGNTWTPLPTSGAPSARVGAGVWTGAKLVVWGGSDFQNGTYQATTAYGDGAAYDPGANSWTALPSTGAPSARVAYSLVWAGDRAIVWGGFETPNFGAETATLQNGAAYDPVGNAWSAVGTSGAPTARAYHTAVWTGTRMIVWGGFKKATNEGVELLGKAEAYNPGNDSWFALSVTDQPSARYGHASVWTGTRMIVWGGYDSTPLADGGIYDPATDTWTKTSLPNAPLARVGHEMLWTGSRALVWGGGDGGGTFYGDGAAYDPAADTWDHVNPLGAPSGRWGHALVWTGTQVFVYGGDSTTEDGPDGEIFGDVKLLTP